MLPCETLIFKNWLLGTLINTGCSLSIVSSNLVIYVAIPQYQFDRFFWLWSFPHTVFTQTVCITRCLHSESAIIYEIVLTHTKFRYVAAEQPSPQYSWLANLGHNSATSLLFKSAGYEWFKVWMMCGLVRLEWNRVFLTMPLRGAASPWLHSSHKRTLWMFNLTS